MNPPLIYIVGSGVLLGKHFTGQSIEVLKKCRKVFTIIQGPPAEWLPAGVEAEIIDLFHLYEIGGNRPTNYDRVVDYLIDAAAPDYAVAYLTYGNPVVFDSVASGILSKAKDKGIQVRIFPSISSIDTILADLGRDMAPGLQIYEASFLVCCNIAPRIDLPCILLQLGVFGTSYATYDKPSSDKLPILADYLLRFYPSDHELFLVNSQTSVYSPASVFRITINDLGRLDPQQEMCQSAYIPALRQPQPDKDFIELMNTVPAKK